MEQTELFRTELAAIKEAHAAQIKELKDQVAGKKTIKDAEVEGREFVVSDPGNTLAGRRGERAAERGRSSGGSGSGN